METSTAVTALAALAQESRLDIFRLLVEAGPAGLPAGSIGEALGLPRATLSFHLNQLRQAGLVAFERQGRSLIYAVEYPAMNALMGYLTENCCRSASPDCAAAAGRANAAIPPDIKGASPDEAPARARRR